MTAPGGAAGPGGSVAVAVAGERAALPSSGDPVVAGAVEALGGAPGRHARLGERRFWTPLRWIVLLTLLTCALGFWQKAPCRVHDWTDEYQYTRACYTDVFALWNAEGLASGDVPYLDHPVEYPVLIGAAMLAVSAVTDDVARVLPGTYGDQVREADRAVQEAVLASGAGSTEAQAAASERAALLDRTFFDLTWVLLTAAAVVVAVTTARLAGRRRVWDAAMVALAPGLLVHATTNWDLLAAALAGLGLVAWARRRPVLAGVLLGLGTATKLYPLLLLAPLLALCWRAGRLRSGLLTATALVLTAGAVTLPVYLASPMFGDVDGAQVRVASSPWDRLPGEGLAALAPHLATSGPSGEPVEGVNAVYRFVELNATRPADWDSLAYALQSTRSSLDGPLGHAYSGLADLVLGDGSDTDGVPTRLNAWVAVGTLVTLALVTLLALRAPRRPRLAQLAFLTVVGFLLTNKVFSPQYVLWVLPLAVLARPRWGPFLAWQATEVLVLFTRFYFFVSLPLGEGDQGSEGIDQAWFLSAVVLRDLALVLLAAAVVRDVLRPERDVVRADATDDPAGGVLDRAPDRVPARA